MSERRILNLVDSEPAKFSCIQGTAETLGCRNIVRAIHMLEATVATATWWSRVPTLSNPADGPSRLEFPGRFLAGGLIASGD